jgi:hypothetical protein
MFTRIRKAANAALSPLKAAPSRSGLLRRIRGPEVKWRCSDF